MPEIPYEEPKQFNFYGTKDNPPPPVDRTGGDPNVRYYNAQDPPPSNVHNYYHPGVTVKPARNFIAYSPTFYENPQNVAQYYKYMQNLPAGQPRPEWLDNDRLTAAYQYFDYINKGLDVQDWGYAANDDPVRDFLQGLRPPPPEIISPIALTNPAIVNQLVNMDPSTIAMMEAFRKGEVPYEDLPDWQKFWVDTMAGPWPQMIMLGMVGTAWGAGLGVPFGGIGIFPGAVIGLGTGLLAAKYVNENPDDPVAQQVLEMLDVFAIWFERGLGIGTVALAITLEQLEIMPDRKLGTLYDLWGTKENLWQSLQAASLMYESSAGNSWWSQTIILSGQVLYGWGENKESLLDIHRGGGFNGRNRFVAWYQENLKTALDVDSWDEVKEMTAPGMVVQFGQPVPVPLLGPAGVMAMVDVRRQLLRGEKTRDEIFWEYNYKFGFSGQFSDFMGQLFLDPIELGPAVVSRGVAKILEVGSGPFGYPGISEAMRFTNRPIAGMMLYREWLKTGAVVDGVPMTSDNLTGFQRWVGGITESGLVKELDPSYAPIPPDNATWVKRALYNLTHLTPEARVREFQSVAHNNIGVMLDHAIGTDGVVDPVKMVGIVKQFESLPRQQIRDVANFLGAPEAQTLKIAWEGAGKMAQEHLNIYQMFDPQRRLLHTMAQILGETPGEFRNTIADPDMAPGMLAKVVEAAKETGDPKVAEGLSKMLADLDVTPESFGDTFKAFSGEHPVELYPQEFQANLHNSLIDQSTLWAIETYGVSDPKPLGKIYEYVATLKSAQSLLLLGLNPSYLVGNVVNNEVTRIASGVGGWVDNATMTAWIDRFGIEPYFMRAGIGAAEIGLDLGGKAAPDIRAMTTVEGKALEKKIKDLQADLAKMAEGSTERRKAQTELTRAQEQLVREVSVDPADVVARARETGEEALRSEQQMPGGVHGKIDQFLAKANNIAPMSVLSRKHEQTASRQAYFAGTRQMWQRLWEDGVGRKGMPPELHQALTDIDPRLPPIIEGAISDVKNKKELQAALFEGLQQRYNVNQAIKLVGKELSIDNGDVYDLLNSINAIEFLKERVQGEGITETDVHMAFNELNRRAQDATDFETARDIETRIQDVANQVGTSGFAQAVQIFDEAQFAKYEWWQRHFDNWQEVFEMGSRSGKDVRNTLFARRRYDANREWNRINKFEQATMKGMVQALGVENQHSRGLITSIIKRQEMWGGFHSEVDAALYEFFNNTEERSFPERQAAWDALQQELNQRAIESYLAEAEIQVEIDNHMATLFEAQFGPDAGDLAKQWRFEQAQFAVERGKLMLAHRQSVKGMGTKERRAAWTKFIQQDYLTYIREYYTREIEWMHDIHSAAQGKTDQVRFDRELRSLDETGTGDPDAPKPDPDEPGPDPGAPLTPQAVDLINDAQSGTPAFVSEAMKQTLRDNGFTDEQISSSTPNDLIRSLSEKVPEGQFNLFDEQTKRQVAAVKEGMQEVTELQRRQKEVVVREIAAAAQSPVNSLGRDGKLLSGSKDAIMQVVLKHGPDPSPYTLQTGLEQVNPLHVAQAFETRDAMMLRYEKARSAARQSFDVLEKDLPDISPELTPAEKKQMDNRKAFERQYEKMISTPRNQLDPVASKAMEQEADAMLNELDSGQYLGLIDQVEKFEKGTGEQSGEAYGDYEHETDNVDWYRALYKEGFKSRSTVRNALVRIVEDGIKDRPAKYVDRMKELIIDRLIGEGEDLQASGRPPHPGILVLLGRREDAARALGAYVKDGAFAPEEILPAESVEEIVDLWLELGSEETKQVPDDLNPDVDQSGLSDALYQADKDPRQSEMFEKGEDTPLFSQSAQKGSESMFKAVTVNQQQSMFDNRPEFVKDKAKQVEGDAPEALEGAPKNIQELPDYRAKVMEGWSRAFPGVGAEEMALFAGILDYQAVTWAEQTGNDPLQWYQQNFDRFQFVEDPQQFPDLGPRLEQNPDMHRKWYSSLVDRVESFEQDIFTIEQLQAGLRKGIKQNELLWSGLQKWTDGMEPGTKITKQQVLELLAEEPIELTENLYGFPKEAISSAVQDQVNAETAEMIDNVARLQEVAEDADVWMVGIHNRLVRGLQTIRGMQLHRADAFLQEIRLGDYTLEDFQNLGEFYNGRRVVFSFKRPLETSEIAGLVPGRSQATIWAWWAETADGRKISNAGGTSSEAAQRLTIEAWQQEHAADPSFLVDPDTGLMVEDYITFKDVEKALGPELTAHLGETAGKINEASEAAEELHESSIVDTTPTERVRHQNVTEEGGSNYREISVGIDPRYLIPDTFEGNPIEFVTNQDSNGNLLYVAKTKSHSGKLLESPPNPSKRGAIEQLIPGTSEGLMPYRFTVGMHFPTENPIFHIRYKDRPFDNNKKTILFLEELQMDLVREATGKKLDPGPGFRKPLPDNHWDQIAELETMVEQLRNEPAGDTGLLMWQAVVSHVGSGISIADSNVYRSTTGFLEEIISSMKKRELQYDATTDLFSANMQAMVDTIGQEERAAQRITPEGETPANIETSSLQAQRQILLSELNITSQPGAFPANPFAKNSSILGLRRALWEAVSTGRDGMGWTDGFTQAERWGMAFEGVQVRVEAIGNNEGTIELQLGYSAEGTFQAEEGITIHVDDVAEHLPDNPDQAKKIMDHFQLVEGVEWGNQEMIVLEGGDTVRYYTDDGLGIAYFYDNVMVNQFNDLPPVKKAGLKMEYRPGQVGYGRSDEAGLVDVETGSFKGEEIGDRLDGWVVVFNDPLIKSIQDGIPLFQGRGSPKAAIQFFPEGPSITGFKNGDISSIWHEEGHRFFQTLTGKEIEVVGQYLGFKDKNGWVDLKNQHSYSQASGNAMDPVAEKKWTSANEKLVDAWMQYAANPDGISGPMRQVFEKMWQWLTDIYDRLFKSGLEADLDAPYDIGGGETMSLRDVIDERLGVKRNNEELQGKVDKSVKEFQERMDVSEYMEHVDESLDEAAPYSGNMPDAEPGLFDRDMDPYYSAVQKRLENIQQENLTVQQLRAALVGKKGIKKAELDWIGVTEYLDGLDPDTVVQISDIRELVSKNRVHIEEVVLGDDTTTDLRDFESDDNFLAGDLEEAVDALDNNRTEIIDALVSTIEAEIDRHDPSGDVRGGMNTSPEALADAIFFELREGQAIGQQDINNIDIGFGFEHAGDYSNGEGRWESMHLTWDEVTQGFDQEFVNRLDIWLELLGEAYEAQASGTDRTFPTRTKFSGYVQPGGTNYRETLLTLPKRPELDTGGQTVELIGMSQMPPPQNYQSGHFDQLNVLAHIRHNDRVLADGGKTLHAEEWQSDWAQQGRKSGFQPVDQNRPHIAALKDAWQRLKEKVENSPDPSGDRKAALDTMRDNIERATTARPSEAAFTFQVEPEQIEAQLNRRFDAWVRAYAETGGRGNQAALDASMVVTIGGSKVPPMPYANSWADLSMRRMLWAAAVGGYDSMSWSEGRVQSIRWDMSNYFEVLEVNPSEGNPGHLDISGVERLANHDTIRELASNVPVEELHLYVGQAQADFILSDTENGTREGGYQGEDLSMSSLEGVGMNEFYDVMLVTKGNKIARLFGSEVRRVKNVIPSTEKGEFGVVAANRGELKKSELDEGWVVVADGGMGLRVYYEGGMIVHDTLAAAETELAFIKKDSYHDMWEIPINDKMRKSLDLGGIPLFQKAENYNPSIPDGERATAQAKWFGKSKVVDDGGNPLQVYHGSTHDFTMFDPSEERGGNIGSYIGLGSYFTDSKADVNANYATNTGPDLVKRIDHAAESMVDTWEYEKGPHKSDVKALADARGIDLEAAETLINEALLIRDNRATMDTLAREIMEATLVENEGVVMPVYLRIVNPIYMDGPNETKLNLESTYDESGDLVDESEILIQLKDAINSAEAKEGLKHDTLWDLVVNWYPDELLYELTFDQLRKALDDDGYMMSRFRDIAQAMGYDGVIMDAGLSFGKSRRFGQPMTGVEGATHYITWDPTQVKGAFNRGTFDSSNPNILYQADADPAATGPLPLGSVDGMAKPEYRGQQNTQGIGDTIRPVLNALLDTLLVQDPELEFRFGDLPPDKQGVLTKWIEDLGRDMASNKLASMKWGENRRHVSVLPYHRRYGADNAINIYAPYAFFYLRTLLNWGIRAIDNPRWYSAWSKIRTFQRNTVARDNYPSRLKDKIQIKAPWMPEWAGDGVYVDPLSRLFPQEIFANPIDYYNKEQTALAQRTEIILQELVETGEVTGLDMEQAMVSREGPAWEKAEAIAEIELGEDKGNPLDFVNLILSPGLHWNLLRNALEGTPEKNSPLPFTRTGQALETLGKQLPFPLSLIGAAGTALAAPERYIREQYGLSEFGEWGKFYVDRQLSNMAAEGVNVDEILKAQIEEKGEVWQEAYDRVSIEQALKVPGFLPLYAASQSAMPNDLMAAVMFGWLPANLFPPGELEQRNLKDVYNNAWSDYNEGNPDALNDFWDDNPEYEARLALWKEPEERLRQNLINNIWGSYFEFEGGNRNAVSDQLGDEFKQSFLDSETRSYDAIDLQTLALWATRLSVPVPDSDLLPPNNINSLLVGAGLIPQELNLIPEEKAGRMQDYRDWRNETYPNWYAVQTGFFREEGSGSKAEYLDHFPELAEYWEEVREFKADNQDLLPYLENFQYQQWHIEEGRPYATIAEDGAADYERAFWQWRETNGGGGGGSSSGSGRSSKGHDLSGIPKALQSKLKRYYRARAFGGSPTLSRNAIKNLERIWATSGFPAGDFETWINGSLRATFGRAWWARQQDKARARRSGGSVPPAEGGAGDSYQFNIQEFSPTLTGKLEGYYFSGQELGGGAIKALQNIWKKNGRPLDDYEEWLNQVLRGYIENLAYEDLDAYN